MNVALLVALLIPTQAGTKGKSVENATSLTDNDWSDNFHAMSLTPSIRWSSGSAWFIRFDEGGLQAWKGTYDFYLPEKESDDAIQLKIGFTRHYIVVADRGQEKWQIDRRYEPKGMLLEIALEDSAVPDKEVTFSVLEGFFVDDRGVETVKRHAPEGILQKLSGRGDARKLRELDCVKIGETLRFRSDRNFYQLTRITDFLPPGFKVRNTEADVKTTTAYRPSSSPTTAKSTPKVLFDSLAAAVDKEDLASASKLAEQLVKITPDSADTYVYRGLANRVLKKWDDAIRDYDKALELKPNTGYYHAKRGRAYDGRHSYREAASDYFAAVGFEPKDPSILCEFAWFLATCPEESARHGKGAVRYAAKACELTDYKEHWALDTLAAAFAENGDFEKAITTETAALKVVTEKNLRTQYEKRLKLYKAGKPFRD